MRRKRKKKKQETRNKKKVENKVIESVRYIFGKFGKVVGLVGNNNKK